MRARTWTLVVGAGAVALAIWPQVASAQAPASAPAAAEQPAPSKPVAVVNGEPITLAQLDLIIKRDGPQAVQLPESKLRELRMGTLSLIIDDTLLTQFLRQNGPRVDPAEVNKRLAEAAEALKKNMKTLQDYYRDAGTTEAEFRQGVALYLQKIDYFKARVTDDDAKRYYDENKDFFDRVFVRASHILLRLPPNAGEKERQDARNKLLAIRQDIVSGKLDFATAAKKFSECPTAPKGGDLEEYFPRKGVVEERFARAAFALQVGQVSDIVETGHGLHLIKVTDRKPGEPSEFTKVKDLARQYAIMEYHEQLIQQLRKTAKIEINLP